jgi:hypothetical protein
MRAGRTGSDDGVVRALQPVFDADLSRNQVDQAAVDEVRRNAARPLFGEQQAFALDSRQAADARTDRAAGANLLLFGQLGQARILDSLARGVTKPKPVTTTRRIVIPFVGPCPLREAAIILSGAQPRKKLPGHSAHALDREAGNMRAVWTPISGYAGQARLSPCSLRYSRSRP